MKKYLITLTIKGKQFSAFFHGKTEQSARNKVKRLYKGAVIVDCKYMGFYIGKAFVRVD